LAILLKVLAIIFKNIGNTSGVRVANFVCRKPKVLPISLKVLATILKVLAILLQVLVILVEYGWRALCVLCVYVCLLFIVFVIYKLCKI